MLKYLFYIGLISGFFISGCRDTDSTNPNTSGFQLLAARIGAYPLDLNDPNSNTEAPKDKALVLEFAVVLDSVSARTSIRLEDDAAQAVACQYGFPDEGRSVSLQPMAGLGNGKTYTVRILNTLKGLNRQPFLGTTIGFSVSKGFLTIDSMRIDGKKNGAGVRVVDINPLPQIVVWFNTPVSESSLAGNTLVLNSRLGPVSFTKTLSADKKQLTVSPSSNLNSYTRYTFQINNTLKGTGGESFQGISQYFYTRLDLTDKFPVVSDDELLTLVQKQTFKYFYDFAHPVSGLALERDQSPQTVTTGGSGFGLMALIVGVERGFITRTQGVERWTKIVNFLKHADRFHGAWPHWMNGNTGKVQPFSTNDDGGDLVETAFMVQGLITVKQYLSSSDLVENQLRGRIDSLCRGVEWDWYRQNNQSVLYWHWSPNVAWAMNFQLRGWNETLITYILAAASPTHTIPKSVYSSGFASSGAMKNGQSYYGFPLPLGPPSGGPLFFAHYSFLGLKPTDLSDAYANYWTQNVNHSKINYAYCMANPRKYVGYGPDCWGLTASDNQVGYNAHSPTNDLGVISPTAALSSFPYTPVESMKALKFFYYKLGDRTWGPYGFYDAFNPTEDWYGRSYLAIDQGPIVVMMENYRTGLLWNLFMSDPEVQQGLTKLGFQY